MNYTVLSEFMLFLWWHVMIRRQAVTVLPRKGKITLATYNDSLHSSPQDFYLFFWHRNSDTNIIFAFRSWERVCVLYVVQCQSCKNSRNYLVSLFFEDSWSAYSPIHVCTDLFHVRTLTVAHCQLEGARTNLRNDRLQLH